MNLTWPWRENESQSKTFFKDFWIFLLFIFMYRIFARLIYLKKVNICNPLLNQRLWNREQNSVFQWWHHSEYTSFWGCWGENCFRFNLPWKFRCNLCFCAGKIIHRRMQITAQTCQCKVYRRGSWCSNQLCWTVESWDGEHGCILYFYLILFFI